jgi:hypothetical protein
MATRAIRDETVLHARIRLSVLWISVTLCYAYGDIIALFIPGGLQMMLDGKMGPWPVSQQLLLGVAVLMAISPVMAFVTIAFREGVVRVLNAVFGLGFLAIALAATIWAWRLGELHYVFLSALEAGMNGLIVWYALRWPGRQAPP